MNNSNIFQVIQSINTFENVNNNYSNNDKMRRDSLTALSTIASNINYTDNNTNNKIQNHCTDRNDCKCFIHNNSIKSKDYGLDIISTASLATSPIPISTSSLELSTDSRNNNNNNNNNNLIDENEMTYNILSPIKTNNENSKINKTRKELLNHHSQTSVSLNTVSSQTNCESNTLLDTAAVVLSTLRSSPFNISDRGSSSYPTPFRYALNPLQISNSNSSSTTTSTTTTTTNNNNNIHINSNSLNLTSPPNNNLLLENTINIRPRSSSFSILSSQNQRPILRVHHKEESSTRINIQSNHKSLKLQNDSIAMIPPDKRNVTWIKNGKRIKNEINNMKFKENISTQIAKRQTIARKRKECLNEVQYKNKLLNDSNTTQEKIKPSNMTNQKDNTQNNKYNLTVSKSKLTEKKKRSFPSSSSSTTKHSTAGTRSRTGCWICRLRKKKCSEEKPKCFNCERLNLDCVYSLVKPDFVTDENLRKIKLQEIKICTREAKRRSMKKRSSSSSSSSNGNHSSNSNTSGKIRKTRKSTNDKQNIKKKVNIPSTETNYTNRIKENGIYHQSPDNSTSRQ